MEILKCCTFLLSLLIFSIINQTASAPGDELWNYTEARPGAHIFWWLMFSRNPASPETRPLVVWLTGGPGAASTGWGNFEEAGPLDWHLQPRNMTWLEHSHLLFIDSPVGSGYSYADSLDLLCTNNAEIAADLVAVLRDVLTNVAPELAASPLVIFGESYSGKMAPELALAVHEAVQAGELNANIHAAISRDGWSSPVDGIISYTNYMINHGLTDWVGASRMDQVVQQTLDEMDAGRWTEATVLFDVILLEMANVTFGVDPFYSLNRLPPLLTQSGQNRGLNRRFSGRVSTRDACQYDIMDEATLDALMEGPIRDKLMERLPNIGLFGVQKQDVYNALTVDFMKPAMSVVERLLNETNIKVAVVNGQQDLIVNTLGVLLWVERLSWPGGVDFLRSPQRPVVLDGLVEGYSKEADSLSMWWVDRAGHSTFYFNPQFGYHLLQYITGIQ